MDKPYWGQRTDYSTAAASAFRDFTQGRCDHPPQASEDWSQPDLSEIWRSWIAF